MTIQTLLAARFASVAFCVLALIGYPRSDDGPVTLATAVSADTPLSIAIDSTAALPDPSTVWVVCGIPRPSPRADAIERLASWDGQRVPVTGIAPGVAAYAARIADGLIVCVANQGAAPREVRMEARLLRGAYTIERFAAPGAPSPVPERFPGGVLGKPGTLPVRETIAPDGVFVYRFTNRSLAVARQAGVVSARVQAVRSREPSLYHKLRVPLEECSSNVHAISRGIRPADRPAALTHIHRAILTSAHAQALAANAADHAVIRDLCAALAEMGDALGELSACCLNLVPAVAVAADPDNPGQQVVVTTLRNCGGWSVSGVRLGVTVTGGAAVQPAEEAVFPWLTPGQSVKATFAVAPKEGAQPAGIQGHYQFVAQKSPAQIHLKPF